MKELLTAVRSYSQPVATVTHGQDAVIACLLMRQVVYTKRPVELKEILGGLVKGSPASSAMK